jgi:hypothetical protein
MLTALIAHWAIAPVSKILMWLSALKFKAAVITGNVHLIAHHYTYNFFHHIAEPYLRWSIV